MGNFQEALSAEWGAGSRPIPLLGQLKNGPSGDAPSEPLRRTDPPKRAAGNRGQEAEGSRPRQARRDLRCN